MILQCPKCGEHTIRVERETDMLMPRHFGLSKEPRFEASCIKCGYNVEGTYCEVVETVSKALAQRKAREMGCPIEPKPAPEPAPEKTKSTWRDKPMKKGAMKEETRERIQKAYPGRDPVAVLQEAADEGYYALKAQAEKIGDSNPNAWAYWQAKKFGVKTPGKSKAVKEFSPAKAKAKAKAKPKPLETEVSFTPEPVMYPVSEDDVIHVRALEKLERLAGDLSLNDIRRLPHELHDPATSIVKYFLDRAAA